MRISLLSCLIIASQICFGQKFKLGALTSFHRDIVRYADLQKPESNKGDEVIYRYKVGIRASYSPWYRMSIEPGLSISTSTFSDEIKADSTFVRAKAKYQISATEIAALQSHSMTTLSPSIGFLFKTNQHKGCVTFITINYSRNYTIRENEEFLNFDESNFNELIGNVQSSNEAKFEHQGSEIDFSFGAYWHIENFDGEFRLEPKFNIYRSRTDNKINTAPDVLLYYADTKGYTNLGFEISINKNIRKQKDIGNNRSEIW